MALTLDKPPKTAKVGTNGKPTGAGPRVKRHFSRQWQL